MSKLTKWIFGHKEAVVVMDGDDTISAGANDRFTLKVKQDHVNDKWDWLLIDNKANVRFSSTAMRGRKPNRSACIKAAKKSIKMIEVREKNEQQQWEDVNL